MSSNPDVPNHIKHLMKVADGVEASVALPSTGGLVPEHEDVTSDSSSSTSDSSSK